MAARQSGAARRERTGLPRVVWVLAGGSFVNNFGGFVVPFLLLYLVHRGYGVGLAAWAVSAYAAGKMAAVFEVEDVVQEALLRVHQAPEAGERIASPRAILRREKAP